LSPGEQMPSRERSRAAIRTRSSSRASKARPSRWGEALERAGLARLEDDLARSLEHSVQVHRDILFDADGQPRRTRRRVIRANLTESLSGVKPWSRSYGGSRTLLVDDPDPMIEQAVGTGPRRHPRSATSTDGGQPAAMSRPPPPKNVSASST
jgi:hypothetical protein